MTNDLQRIEQQRRDMNTRLLALEAAFIAFTRGVERTAPGSIDAALVEMDGMIMRANPTGDGSVFVEVYEKARSLLTKPTI